MNGGREENGHEVDLTSDGGEDTEEANPVTDIDEIPYGVHTVPTATIPGTMSQERNRKRKNNGTFIDKKENN